jgi:hypothetical protein
MARDQKDPARAPVTEADMQAPIYRLEFTEDEIDLLLNAVNTLQEHTAGMPEFEKDLNELWSKLMDVLMAGGDPGH